jgi:gluconate 2-dehydrogenase alpha chain
VTRRLQAVDIVIVGSGWTGGIMLRELADTGLRILGLERGPDLRGQEVEQDELRYAQRHALMQDTARETITFRNRVNQTALPMRRLGSFLLGTGSGGAGVTWNGITTRFNVGSRAPQPDHRAVREGRNSGRHAAAGLGRVV